MVVEEKGKWYLVYRGIKIKCATKIVAERELRKYERQEETYKRNINRNRERLSARNKPAL